MKILMFNYSLWKNNLVRSFPFGKKISEEHEVIFSGFLAKGTEIYKPYQDLLNYLPIRLDSKYFLSDVKKLISELNSCDLIHCFKIVSTSYFTSLIFKFLKRVPLVLDIEDLDWYPVNWSYMLKPTAFSNYLHRLADAKIIHTSILQEIYGGEIIRTGTDTNFFKPNIKGSNELKERLGLEDKFVIPFLGAPRRYKGIELILESIKCLGKKDITFLLVGNHRDEHFLKLYPKYKKFIKILPPQLYEDMPKYLTMSDLVILPQMDYGLWSRAQIPAKLYDSMSAAKPIIVSNVGDLPDIIGDTGIVLNGKFEKTYPTKSEIKECCNAIETVYNNPKESKKLGLKARKRCIKYYDWNILKKKTLDIYNTLF